MKRICNRITALALVLLMTASLLASCSKEAGENTVTEVEGIPVYDKYTSREIDLGLTEDETILNVVEEEGMIRATIGVDEKTYDPDEDETIPYRTEYRYYDMNYAEDATRREKTGVYHELSFDVESSVEVVLGGEPFEDEYGRGVQYRLYQNGEMQETVFGWTDEEDEDPADYATAYGVLANLILYEGVPFLNIDFGIVSYDSFSRGIPRLYIDSRGVDTTKWVPGYPNYTCCGLIGIDGIPYALLEIDEKGYLVPLDSETTTLTMEGTEIEGCPTGGALTDGKYGYFMSNTELWRTNGTQSQCIADLVSHGVTKSSAVRAISALSDGRLLAVADGKLVELSNVDDDQAGGVKIYNIGVLDFYGDSESIKEFELLVSKYNNQAENIFFRVKEFDEKSKLNLALLSGEIAMVITPDQFTLKNYVKQGVLAPLEEVAPALFEKGVLIESVVNATRVGGVCYYLPVNFELCGESIADPGLLKDGTLFETRENYYAYINAHDPEYFKLKTPGDVLSIFAQDIDEWIDWETNTCHFDDGTFAATLEFCSQGSSYEELLDNFAVADLTARTWTANSFSLKDALENYRFTDAKKALEYQKEMPKAEGTTENPTAWVQVDFPMPSRVHSGYEINAHNLYAVVDNEECQGVAANFLEWLILEDVVKEFPENTMDPFAATGWDGFSINRDETDRYLRRLLNGTIDPEEVVATIKPEVASQFPGIINSMRNEAIIHNMKCGQNQYDVTWRYIENADHLRYYQNEIYDVISEEAGRYFGGMITAKQAADYVQNRISLYLAEQS